MLDIIEFQQNCKNNINDTFTKQSNEIVKTYHTNGKISYETEYKNGAPYKEKISDNTGKLDWIRYFDNLFTLSKNVQNWEKAPQIDFEKRQDGKTITLQIGILDNDPDGSIGCDLNITNKDGNSFGFSLFINSKEICYSCNDTDSIKLKEALLELQNIISSDKYKQDFGSSNKLNNGIKNAIKYIEAGESGKKQ